MRLLLLLAFAAQAWGATLSEYLPHATGDHVAGMLVRQDSGEWASEWIAYGGGKLEWRDPHTAVGNFEYMSVRNGWIYLDRLDQWQVLCTRAELEDAGGVATTIDCSSGHPYVPLLLPKDPFTVRVWGTVGGQLFYWQSVFTPGVQVLNTCWYQGPRTMEAIEQQDSWWAQNSGWVRAIGTLPYSNGQPVRPTVNNKYRVTLVKGIGVWTIHDDGVNLCAYSTWSWN